MIDQSHNLKPKIEEMIQTALAAQELFAKAALVDHAALASYQAACSLVDAEECLKAAFYTDVRPILLEWRRSRRLPEDPLAAFRESGYQQRISKRACRTEHRDGQQLRVTDFKQPTSRTWGRISIYAETT